MTDQIPGEYTTYISCDSVEGEDSMNWPTEVLNTINVSGMPPHLLHLKVGMVLILLRNVNFSGGLCNGTRLRVIQLKTRVILAEVLSEGPRRGDYVFIPRMPIIARNGKLPCLMTRIQFPVRPAFAMTINRSQGATLDRVGLVLFEHGFSHGQLYVALSRVQKYDSIKVWIRDNQSCAQNIVWPEILF